MGEFELIAAIRHAAATLPDNSFEGIGDDCAVLPIGADEALVFTADALNEGVHFLRAATSPFDLGHKTLAVNLSDVASMGVAPTGVLLTLGLPDDLPPKWSEEFMAGFLALANRHRVALIGGDTTRSLSGITLTVTAIGRGPVAHLKRRRAAQVGDIIFVSGPLGGSAVGLNDLLNGHLDTPMAHLHRCPEPEIEAGIWLGSRGEVHAMMDISDGVASDIGHILDESGVGAELELTAIPCDEGATLRQALTGGEDYRLLFTADSTKVEALMADFEAHFARPLYPIGRITEGGLRWTENKKPSSFDGRGYTHF